MACSCASKCEVWLLGWSRQKAHAHPVPQLHCGRRWPAASSSLTGIGCLCSSIFFLCWQQLLVGESVCAVGDGFNSPGVGALLFATCCICLSSLRTLISSSVSFLPWRSVVTSSRIFHSPGPFLALASPSFIGTYTSMYMVCVQLQLLSHLQFFFVHEHCLGQSQCRF